MKKKLLLAILLINFMAHAQDNIGLMLLPLILGEGENPELYWSIGPTLSTYQLSKNTVLDLGGNKDFLKHNSSKIVPGFCFNIGRDLKNIKRFHQNINLNYGFKISYAHRNKAVRSDYFEAGATTAALHAKQDVCDLRFTPYFEFEKNLKNHFKYGLSVGFGLGVKTLDNFKLYEKSTNAYIGQQLKSGYVNFLGEFGIKFEWKSLRGYDFKVDYNFSIGGARYKRKVYIDKADSAASVRFQDQAFMIGKQYIMLPKKPKINLHIYRFGVTIGKDF